MEDPLQLTYSNDRIVTELPLVSLHLLSLHGACSVMSYRKWSVPIICVSEGISSGHYPSSFWTFWLFLFYSRLPPLVKPSTYGRWGSKMHKSVCYVIKTRSNGDFADMELQRLLRGHLGCTSDLEEHSCGGKFPSQSLCPAHIGGSGFLVRDPLRCWDYRL